MKRALAPFALLLLLSGLIAVPVQAIPNCSDCNCNINCGTPCWTPYHTISYCIGQCAGSPLCGGFPVAAQEDSLETFLAGLDEQFVASEEVEEETTR